MLMPEGPEVWILSEALNILSNNPDYSKSYGKHLFITNNKIGIRELTFGLTGKLKVIINENKNNNESESEITLEKQNIGFCYGDDKIISEQLYITTINKTLGLNFMKVDKDTFDIIVSKWSTSKRKLGALLLEQKEIAGIGVAWGSEILYKSALNPDIKACEQNLSNLSQSLYIVQQYCIKVYTDYLYSITNQKDNNINNLLVSFIDGWYKNLYSVREMSIYKKGMELKSGGRVWWVKNNS
jgi:formamidopyrimidine-DNA glycosylase